MALLVGGRRVNKISMMGSVGRLGRNEVDGNTVAKLVKRERYGDRVALLDKRGRDGSG